METKKLKEAAESATVIKLRDAARKSYKEIEERMGLVPDFFRRFPESGLLGAWEELKGIYFNPNSALPAKTKDLIGLAIDSQIPCELSFHFDREFGRVDGVTEQEAYEAVATSAIVRHWSAILDGAELEKSDFRRQVQLMVEYVSKKQKAA